MEWIKIKAQVFLISFSLEERFKKTNISFCSPQCQPRFLLLLSQRTKLTTDKFKFVAKKLLLFRFWLEDFQKKGWRPSLFVLFVVAFQRKGWIEFVLRKNNSSIFNTNDSNNHNTINGSSNNNHNSTRWLYQVSPSGRNPKCKQKPKWRHRVALQHFNKGLIYWPQGPKTP